MKNREQKLLYLHEYYEGHKNQLLADCREYYKANMKRIRARVREYNTSLRKDGLKYYSGDIPKCAKCGFEDTRALSIDHINGRQTKHREKHIYLWIKKHNYPSGLQVLCQNCQFDKRVENNEYGARGPRKSSNNELFRGKHKRVKLKTEVLGHYSGGMPRCVKCGIDGNNHLSIDHVNGGGSNHRRKLGTGGSYSFYLWLRKNKYPEGYQVLCMNCQCIKRDENGEYYRGRNDIDYPDGIAA